MPRVHPDLDKVRDAPKVRSALERYRERYRQAMRSGDRLPSTHEVNEAIEDAIQTKYFGSPPRRNPAPLDTIVVVFTEDAFTGAWHREGQMTLAEFLDRNEDVVKKKAEVIRDFSVAGGTYTHRARKDGEITWRIELQGGPYGRRK